MKKILAAGAQDRWLRLAVDVPAVVVFDIAIAVRQYADGVAAGFQQQVVLALWRV